MMRKLVVLVLAVAFLALAVTPVMAAPGGMPGLHGVDGKTFGEVVSALATTNPQALAEHVQGCWAP